MKTFKQYIKENVNDELFQLRTRWNKMGVDVFAWIHYGDIQLSSIKVDKEKRGQGLGTQVMKELLDFAQKGGYRVTLTPSKDLGATSVDRLIKFYKNLGFIMNSGKNRDYRITDTMIWTPNGK